MSEHDRQRGELFLKEYFGASISGGSRRLASYICDPKYWRDDGYNQVSYTVEPSRDIQLTCSGYDSLMDYLGYKSHTTPGFTNIDTYERQLAKKRAVERKIRNDNPAVEKAYKKYRMLVDLVADGKEIED